MKTRRIEEMHGGWFIGDFTPSVLRTSQFEVGYKVHPKGERWPAHRHQTLTEINYLVRGRMTVQQRELTAGDIFILAPGEAADPEFLEDCEVVIVKVPSVPGDKHEV